MTPAAPSPQSPSACSSAAIPSLTETAAAPGVTLMLVGPDRYRLVRWFDAREIPPVHSSYSSPFCVPIRFCLSAVAFISSSLVPTVRHVWREMMPTGHASTDEPEVLLAMIPSSALVQ